MPRCNEASCVLRRVSGPLGLRLSFAMPFHPRLRTRVVMALKNAGELLRRADNGELSVRGPSGLRLPMPQLAPNAPFQQPWRTWTTNTAPPAEESIRSGAALPWCWAPLRAAVARSMSP
ncbi:hypothetical protein GCM10010304_81960 [Streptomyces roseoviolaceus]